jgi:hypothetical protein
LCRCCHVVLLRLLHHHPLKNIYTCVCVCVCVCACVCICICIYMHIHVCMYVCMHVCMYVYIPCSSLTSPLVQETRWRSSASACLQFLGTSRTQLRHRDAPVSPRAPGLRQPRNSARRYQQSRGLGINSENFSVPVHLPYKGQNKMDF